MAKRFRLIRMNVGTICKTCGDPCHVDEVFEYMCSFSDEARCVADDVDRLWAELIGRSPYRQLLEEHHKFSTLSDQYEFKHAFAQGVLSAFQMFLGLPYIKESEPEDELLHENDLEKLPEYIAISNEESRTRDEIFQTADSTCALLFDKWKDLSYWLTIIKLRFMFLFGLEYAIYLCKTINPDFQENMELLISLYSLISPRIDD